LRAALGIIWAAGHRLFDPQPIEQVGWGLALSVASSALNGLLAWAMFRSAREHRSIALEADAKHLVTDVWTSVGVVVGMALVSFHRLAVAGPGGGHRRGAEHPVGGLST
jgi:divalent metal cation (Fe/Co/Zn/Cd) transporter